MFQMKDADKLFPKSDSTIPELKPDHSNEGGLYMVNQVPFTPYPADPVDITSHTFIVSTVKDPDTGKETAKNAYSWVNDKGGSWEDPLKDQNIRCGQAAIDQGMAKKLGDGNAVIAAEKYFDVCKDQKGEFWNPTSPRLVCKTAADNFWVNTKNLMEE